MRERKTKPKSWLWRDTHSLISLPRARQGRRWREEKTLFIWLLLWQQEGDAQGGLVLRAGLQLAPRGWEAAGCIPTKGRVRAAQGPAPASLAVMGQPQESLRDKRLEGNGILVSSVSLP